MAGKRILICFDGTGNDPSDAVQRTERDGEVGDNSISNVLKLFLLAGGRLDHRQVDPQQLAFYHAGVGTQGSIFRRTLASAFAKREPATIQREAYEQLKKHYQPGDQIFVFGFSRGAAIARKFAVQLGQGSIETAFLGVWDSVASFGKPNLDRSTEPVSDVVFENGTISPAIRVAYHLVAVDETRLAFRPVLMNHCDRACEIWFPGVHSDVGGGYAQDGLSDVALSFMLDRAREHGVRFLQPGEVPYGDLGGDEVIELNDVELGPDVTGKLHLHTRDAKVAAVTLAPRKVYVAMDDVVSDQPPLLHESVIRRMRQRPDYRPVNLKGLRHRLLRDDKSSTEHTDVFEHV